MAAAKQLRRQAGWGKGWDSVRQQAAQATAKPASAAPMDAPTTPAYQAGVTQGLSAYLQQHPDKAALAYGPALKSLLAPAQATADATYGSALTNSYGGEGATALDLGATLSPTVTDPNDPNFHPENVTQGDFNWGDVEATNPFSKAALLVRNFTNQQGKSTTDFAAQGLFGSGALARQHELNTFGFQENQDALKKALNNYLTGQAQSRVTAAGTRDQSVTNAALPALQSLLGS